MRVSRAVCTPGARVQDGACACKPLGKHAAGVVGQCASLQSQGIQDWCMQAQGASRASRASPRLWFKSDCWQPHTTTRSQISAKRFRLHCPQTTSTSQPVRQCPKHRLHGRQSTLCQQPRTWPMPSARCAAHCWAGPRLAPYTNKRGSPCGQLAALLHHAFSITLWWAQTS